MYVHIHVLRGTKSPSKGPKTAKFWGAMQKHSEGSNLSRSATVKSLILQHFLALNDTRGNARLSRAVGTRERRIHARKTSKWPGILPEQVEQYRFR